MLFTFLLVLQALIAALLVTVILMQKSEGGGLGMGGSPSGLMSARGAADFLTRATTTLATIFVILNIALAVIAATRHDTNIDTSLAHGAATAPAAPAPATADDNAPFASAAQQAAGAGTANQAAARAPASNSAVPLEH